MATSATIRRALWMTLRSSRPLLPNHGRRCLFATNATSKAESDEGSQEKSAGESAEQTSQSNEQLDKLTTQVKKLEGDLKESKDKYMRSLAETENLRKRMVKQVDDAKQFGIQGFCKDLLEVSDILTTAVGTVPKEELKDSNPHLVNLFEGLNMTESQLTKVFEKHGLVSISPTEGEKFNPQVHEALFQVPLQDQKEPDTIAVVQKIGFKLHDRTLRPALVGVFKGS